MKTFSMKFSGVKHWNSANPEKVKGTITVNAPRAFQAEDVASCILYDRYGVGSIKITGCSETDANPEMKTFRDKRYAIKSNQLN